MSNAQGTVARNDALPPQARARYLAIQGLATDARDAAQSAQRRIDELRKGLTYSEVPPENAGGIEMEIGRLQSVRQAQNLRHQELAALATAIQDWLRSLPRGLVLEMAPAISEKPLKGETVAQAIKRVRDEIGQARLMLRQIEAAPLPKDELKAIARYQIEDLAERGKPTINTDRHALSVNFLNSKAYAADPYTPVYLMAWLHKEAVIKKVEAQIDAAPEPAMTLSDQERDRRLEEGKGSLDRLERFEELLIERAITEGSDVLRRADASPRAVLGVTTAQPKRERVERKDKAA
jgi:hypothetical protein